MESLFTEESRYFRCPGVKSLISTTHGVRVRNSRKGWCQEDGTGRGVVQLALWLSVLGVNVGESLCSVMKTESWRKGTEVSELVQVNLRAPYNRQDGKGYILSNCGVGLFVAPYRMGSGWCHKQPISPVYRKTTLKLIFFADLFLTWAVQNDIIHYTSHNHVNIQYIIIRIKSTYSMILPEMHSLEYLRIYKYIWLHPIWYFFYSAPCHI